MYRCFRLRCFFLTLWISLLYGWILGTPPPLGYYASAEGKLGEELRLALGDIISGHTRVSYSWPPFYVLDRDPTNSNNVLLIYSVFSKPHDSHHQVWNREHIWSRSRGLGSSGTAHDDLFNLRPCDPGVNSARGNLAFGYPDPTLPNYVGPGHYEQAPLASRDSDRWLPPEADKGFIARAMFYMATRYNGEGTEPDLYLTATPPTQSPWGTEMGDIHALLQWNRKHPPVEFERRRNRLIYEQFQHNRNPFIDYPDLVDAAFTYHLYLAPGTWRVKHFTFEELNDPTVSGWAADPDGDGRSNLFEYALGTNPRKTGSTFPITILPAHGPVGQWLLSYREVKDADLWGLNYTVEGSSDLETWTEVEPTLRWFSEDGPNHRTVFLDLPSDISHPTRQFFRLRVTLE